MDALDLLSAMKSRDEASSNRKGRAVHYFCSEAEDKAFANSKYDLLVSIACENESEKRAKFNRTFSEKEQTSYETEIREAIRQASLDIKTVRERRGYSSTPSDLRELKLQAFSQDTLFKLVEQLETKVLIHTWLLDGLAKKISFADLNAAVNAELEKRVCDEKA